MSPPMPSTSTWPRASAYPHFTVFDNIAFPLRTRRVDRTSIAERVAAAAERLGLSDLLSGST